jgi:hypothetical protein
MHRTLLRYVVLLVVFGGATAAVLVYGARLKPDPTVAEKPARAAAAVPGTAPPTARPRAARSSLRTCGTR